MAEDQVPDRDESPLQVNLQIISPSVGVSAPLSFRGLPSKTTIRELKAMIRDAIPLRPSNEHQRLIHRGRLLSRDPDTLEDVFGAETVRCPRSQACRSRYNLPMTPGLGGLSMEHVRTWK